MEGPKAPKDPVAKRPAVYVMADAVIEGSPRGNGKFQDICYLNGRIAQKINVLCDKVPKEIVELMPETAGFRKVVHSIGIMVNATKAEHRTDKVLFTLNCLAKEPGQDGSRFCAEVPCNGEEVKIFVADVPENENDGLLGSFVTTFPSHETAKLTVCFYLNEGYTAPELTLDPPVEFGSAAYRKMIERSLVQTGNLYRLQRAIAKAKRGEDVTVAYLGGSITQGAGAKPINTDCYANLSCEAFKKRFGNGGAVKLIKAGAGGTCSELGLTRYEMDVLRYGEVTPDVVFVEYAVNDAGDETNGVCFESLVRMIQDGPGNPAVVLLFAVFMDDYNLQERMIPVGTRCQVPMISVKNAVTPQFYDETPIITKRQYFYDLFHPSNMGHQIMADCIDYFFEQAEAAAEEPADAVIESTPAIGETYRKLKTFDRSNYKKHAAVKELCEGAFTETDTVLQYVEKDLDSMGSPEFPNNWKKAPGTDNAAFMVRMECKDVLLVYKDTDSVEFGKVQVLVDGTVTRVIDPREIGWNHCSAYVVYNSEQAAEHEIKVVMQPGDESKGFTILGIGYTLE